MDGGGNRVAWIVNVVGADTGIQAGHSAWLLNGGKQIIQSYIDTNMGHLITASNADIVWSVFVSVQVVGQIVGAQIGSNMGDKYGRRNTLRWNTLVFILGNILQFIPGLFQHTALWPLLFIGRLVQTIGVGIGQSIVVAYITEISPTSKRGLYASTYNLYNTIASFIVVILTLDNIAGTTTGWYWLMLIPIPASVLWFILSWYVPESPRYLIGTHDPTLFKKAVHAIAFYKSIDDTTAEIEALQMANDLRLEIAFSTARQLSFHDPRWYDRGIIGRLRRKELRVPFMIMFSLSIGRALSGYNIIFSYSTFALTQTGLSNTVAEWGSIIVATIRLAMSIPLGFIIEKFGRKWPIIISNWVIFLSYVLLCISTQAHQAYLHQAEAGTIINGTVTEAAGHATRWPAILGCVALFIWPAAFVFGIGTVHRFVVAEIFAQSDRAIAQKLLVQIDALLSLVYTFSYLPLFPIMHGWVYLLILIPLIPLSILISLYLPETKNTEVSVIVSKLNRKSSVSIKPEVLENKHPLLALQRMATRSRMYGTFASVPEENESDESDDEIKKKKSSA